MKQHTFYSTIQDPARKVITTRREKAIFVLELIGAGACLLVGFAMFTAVLVMFGAFSA